MVQTDRQTPLSPLDYHYNVVEFSRILPQPMGEASTRCKGTQRVRARSEAGAPRSSDPPAKSHTVPDWGWQSRQPSWDARPHPSAIPGTAVPVPNNPSAIQGTAIPIPPQSLAPPGDCNPSPWPVDGRQSQSRAVPRWLRDVRTNGIHH